MEELSNIRIERGLSHSYLIIEGTDTMPDNYQVKMMMNNKIPSLLKLDIHMADGNYNYYYEISSKQDMYSLYENKQMDHEALSHMLENVLMAYEMTREYMLDETHLILNPRYIYVSGEDNAMEFMFYDAYTNTIESSFQTLAEYILDRADHTDAKAVKIAYDLYKLIKTHNFSLASIMELIKEPIEIEEDKKDDVGTSLSTTVLVNQEVNREEVKSKKGPLLKMIGGKKEKDDKPAELMVIDNNRQAGPYHQLIRKGQGKELVIDISTYPITMGSNKSMSDVHLKDNSVSASHIKIYQNKEAIFMQNISKDKATYINEMQLEKEESIMLESGDILRIGKMKFEFK